MLEIRTLLVPIDFSAHSLGALERACDLAREFDAALHLLHCYEIPTPGLEQYRIALPETVWERIHAGAEQWLAALAEKTAAAGLRVTSEVSAEAPGHAIVEVARRVDADIVVLGTRGTTGVKHFLLGSVAERTVRTAPCNVLVVK